MLFETIWTLFFIGAALAANTFIRPAANEIIQADGGSYGIQWTPDPADAVVTIVLVNGTAPVDTLASEIPNSGLHVWIIPRNLTAGRYSMAIAGGAANATPTDITTSGEFIITGDSAYSSSLASSSVASSLSSVASSLASRISSLSMSSASHQSIASMFGSSSGASAGSSAAGGSASATPTSGASAGAGGSSSTGAAAATSSTSTGSSGTSGTERIVRHADFAVIILALGCLLMQI